MKEKVNEIASKFATALAVALVGWTAFAGLVVQKAPKEDVWNDEEIVTNAYLTGENASGSVRTLPKYLWLYKADDSYPDAAAEYYRSRGDGRTEGGCSAVRDGGFLSRNFDFPFDDRAEFVVKMSAGVQTLTANNQQLTTRRYASIGVAQVGTNLTEAIVTSGKPSRCYKWLPGATVDGINENGVVAEINVVDGEPPASTGGDIHPLAAVRWALDNGTSARMVATNLASRIMWPGVWRQNFHWMIADATETWIVENGMASNVTAVAAKRVMTNFAILPDDYEGMGAERYALLLGGANITNAWYTRSYRRDTTPPWVSDLNGLDTNVLFRVWAEKSKEQHRGESFNGTNWWQTVHTSIYDISNLTLRVAVQEVDDWYTFAVPSAGVVKPEAVKEIVTPMIGSATNGLRRVDDMAVYESGVVPEGPWTWTGENVELVNQLNSEGIIPRFGQYGVWDVEIGDFHGWYFTGSGLTRDYNAETVKLGPLKLPEYDEGTEVYATRPRVTKPTSDRLATTNGVNAAIEAHHDDTKQNTLSSAQLANIADVPNKRPLTDNTCYKTEFTPWVAHDVPSGVTLIGQPEKDHANIHWIWHSSGGVDFHSDADEQFTAEELEFGTIEGQYLSFTATRVKVASEGHTFATEDYVTNSVNAAVSTNNPAFVSAVRNTPTSGMPEDMPTDWGTYGTVGAALAALAAFVKWAKAKIVAVIGDDGKPTDTFATDLLGKPVAKEAIDGKSVTSAANIPNHGVAVVSGSAGTAAIPVTVAVTFAAATGNELRMCELLITGVAEDNAVTVDLPAGTYQFADGADATKKADGNHFIFTEYERGKWFVNRVSTTAEEVA